MTNPDRPCPHENFNATVDINRIGTEETSDGMPRAYVADIRVRCADCKEPFRWTGLRAGVSFAHPMVSVDETELHAPLRPASADPDFGMGLPGFAISYREANRPGCTPPPLTVPRHYPENPESESAAGRLIGIRTSDGRVHHPSDVYFLTEPTEEQP